MSVSFSTTGSSGGISFWMIFCATRSNSSNLAYNCGQNVSESISSSV
ncbi:hypothetical protein LI139_01405 [Veillonella atypica]|nr:hypothetical protein [Veillonella atypica]